MTEEAFWQATPKKLQSLFLVYRKINGIDDDEIDTIDNILFQKGGEEI